MIVIGGSAAALAYQAELTTSDIDTANDVATIQTACHAAIAKTGLRIPVSLSSVADGPYLYEERLQPLKMKGLRRLSILVPEKHDLVLMKVVRGYEHDFEQAEQIHRHVGLELGVLVARFQDEMGHIIGRKENLKLNFLALVERLYGSEVASNVERQISAVRSGKKPR